GFFQPPFESTHHGAPPGTTAVCLGAAECTCMEKNMIDPRAYSENRIIPPEPLPHVSRKALKRVTHALPIPTVCPYCGSDVDLVNNSEIYRGKSYGDWPYAYRCANFNGDCDSFVGLHPDTDLPLGTLADKPLREARNRCKRPFERIWRDKLMTRNQAYAWLAAELQIMPPECHFGLFDVDRCERAKRICDQYLEAIYTSSARWG
ncbi:zinc-finger-containing protein, partial [Pseudomonas aeruginosa]